MDFAENSSSSHPSEDSSSDTSKKERAGVHLFYVLHFPHPNINKDSHDNNQRMVNARRNTFFIIHRCFKLPLSSLRVKLTISFKPCICNRYFCSKIDKDFISYYLKGTIFLRELNFADVSLERKLEPVCELFDLCFSHLKNFAGT